MIAEHFAVVGGIDDPCVVQQTLSLERLQHDTDRAVVERNLGVVVALQRSALRLGHVLESASREHPLDLGRYGLGRPFHDRRRHILGIEHVPVSCRRVKRRMRPRQADLKVERPVVGIASYPLRRRVGDVHVDVLILLEEVGQVFPGAEQSRALPESEVARAVLVDLQLPPLGQEVRVVAAVGRRGDGVLDLVGVLVSPVMQARSVVARVAVIGLVQPEMGLADHRGAVTGVPDVPDVTRPMAVRLGAIAPGAVLVDV